MRTGRRPRAGALVLCLWIVVPMLQVVAAIMLRDERHTGAPASGQERWGGTVCRYAREKVALIDDTSTLASGPAANEFGPSLQLPVDDDDQERRGDCWFLANEQSWRTARRAGSLLSWTTSTRRMHRTMRGCSAWGKRA